MMKTTCWDYNAIIRTIPNTKDERIQINSYIVIFNTFNEKGVLVAQSVINHNEKEPCLFYVKEGII